jgi:hypothetical protein
MYNPPPRHCFFLSFFLVFLKPRFTFCFLCFFRVGTWLGSLGFNHVWWLHAEVGVCGGRHKNAGIIWLVLVPMSSSQCFFSASCCVVVVVLVAT